MPLADENQAAGNLESIRPPSLSALASTKFGMLALQFQQKLAAYVETFLEGFLVVDRASLPFRAFPSLALVHFTEGFREYLHKSAVAYPPLLYLLSNRLPESPVIFSTM
jgi:hypothetical protein